ncbi:tetratricopeptide repeat protein [Polaromonas sp. A23]|uniref:tetratricopeptide repeat protein n=1 Tax=Polaromonas sp. A23 TaxID=1944133 RepID=UPI00098427CB|nr:tetratricopeptide repeat protein [Polaromonas sp. A23]OOG44429.1 hypothetical protein B0B52_06705 [Polaromonas sp. A23]
MKNKPTTETSFDENETLGLAITCIEDCDFGNAMAHLKVVLDHNPQHEIATGMLAALYSDLKMTARAAEYFQRVLAINPENPLAHVQMGLLQFSNQQPQDALNSWKTCLEDPNDFLLNFYSGLALLQLGRSDEARSLFDIAAQRMPEDHWLQPQLQDLLKII